MALTPGARIGLFEIVAQIGQGGMGQVYRAHDTRLGRDVALKVLPDLFTSDRDRVARFEREAKVLASLNHPNIAHVYGFEPPADGTPAAIAMELVDGQTLQELLDSERTEGVAHGVPLDRALPIMRQIAIALDAAHEIGIIHRDLKPANVKVREDGTVKVLDFGLAKALDSSVDSSFASGSAAINSPTFTSPAMTQMGMILGTAAYMSPEQAKGRAVDRRADVWAFGVVFFELLAGRRAFDGDDVSEVLASVLKSDPEWDALPADLPPAVRRLLRRCLEKDPRKRLRDVAEGMLQLDDGLANGSTTPVTTPASGVSTSGISTGPPLWRRAAPVVVTAVASTFLVGAVSFLMRPAAPEAPVVMRSRHIPTMAAPLSLSTAHSEIALSPDGRTLVYNVATGGRGATIHARALDQLDAVAVRGAQPAVSPFFSSDSKWLGFLEQNNPMRIRKVPLGGGTSALVTTARSAVLGATWIGDEIIFGTRTGPLFAVKDGGGEHTQLTSLDTSAGDIDHMWPHAVPGTSIVLFAVSTGQGPRLNPQLAALDRATGKVVRLQIDGSYPRHLATGHIVYATADRALRAVPFDLERMQPTGPPVPVLDGLGIKPSGAANYDVSRNGHLIYTAAGSGAPERTISWIDRRGRETPIEAPARAYFYVRISPDGTRLSLDARDQEQDIWIWDLQRESMERLTDKVGADQYGLWTPDHHIIFSSASDGRVDLFRHRPSSTGKPEQLTDTGSNLVPYPNAITPDGKQVIFRSGVGNGTSDLFITEIAGERKIRPLIATEHDERNAELSPKGDYIVYESTITGGRAEIFASPFPALDRQVKVSTDGGSKPFWSHDGKEIFYLTDRNLMSVPVAIGGDLRLGKPAVLFNVDPFFAGGAGRNYDVSRDGQRFVMVKSSADPLERQMPITIVLNWIEEVRARIR